MVGEVGLEGERNEPELELASMLTFSLLVLYSELEVERERETGGRKEEKKGRGEEGKRRYRLGPMPKNENTDCFCIKSYNTFFLFPSSFSLNLFSVPLFPLPFFFIPSFLK